jgi:ABC-type amino acid transport system permease subunit
MIDGLYRAVIYDQRWKMYLQGVQFTLLIAMVACIIGIVLGLLVAICKTAFVNTAKPLGRVSPGRRLFYIFMRVLYTICEIYTTIIRGTPLVVQLLILYRMAMMPNGEVACFIGFGLNSGAYVSEIFRSGIQSVDPGQMEAGRSLGLSRGITLRYVILPQAIKNVLPAIFNEFISLVKETSIAGYIAVNDLTKMSNAIRNRTYDSTSLFIAAIIYLILTFVLTRLQKGIERRYAKSDRN